MHNACVGKLTAFLPQEVALWRLQNNWAFMCCSTTESILSWQPLAPLFSTGQSITTGNIISFTQFQVPASPPQPGYFILSLSSPGATPWAQCWGLFNLPFQKALSRRPATPPESWCAGVHRPDALCKGRRKWKCWNKQFGIASWLG